MFKDAFDATMGHEGKYSNDPVDPGGETYRGIARNYHPNWEGWETLDASDIKPNTGVNPILDQSVERFYKSLFWDVWWGDVIDSKSGIIAQEMFDTGVNQGHKRAVSYLQEALNALNRNEKLYDNLVEDGSVGPKTVSAFSDYLKTDNEQLLFKIMNVLQGWHYIKRMKQSETQEKYARGWFNRVIFVKDSI